MSASFSQFRRSSSGFPCTSGAAFPISYSNRSPKMHRSDIRAWDRQTDGQIDIAYCPIQNEQQQRPFNGPLSGTTQVSLYLKGKTNLDFTEARDSEWQWYQLGHMQVCTSLQTGNHTSTHHSFFAGWMPFLPASDQCQSTEGTTTRLKCNISCRLLLPLWLGLSVCVSVGHDCQLC